MELDSDGIILTLVGTAAGILILAGWIEQIYKGYRTKRLKDFSKFLMIFVGAGSALWLVYGIMRSDAFIIGTNATGLMLMVTVLSMTYRYDRRLAHQN